MREPGVITKIGEGSRCKCFGWLGETGVVAGSVVLCMDAGSRNRYANLLETVRFGEGQ